MDKKEKEQLMGLSTTEKILAIVSKELADDVQLHEDSVIGDTPIMECTFKFDLGLDSLSFINICHECGELFRIEEDVINIKESDTIGMLYDIIQLYDKGEV